MKPISEDLVTTAPVSTEPASTDPDSAAPDSTAIEIVDFRTLPEIACPCGTAKRALMNLPSVPYSLHLTKISIDAKVHYHKRITETYFFLECDSDAAMELDGVKVPVQPYTAIVIPPGTRHRAVGKMSIMLIATPKFDPTDEWFD